MKILHADTDDLDNPLRGGQPVRTWAINSRLSKDADITVFTSAYKGCQRKLTRGAVDYERLGLRIPRFGLSAHLSFLAALGPKIARTQHDLVVEEFTPPVGFALTAWWTHKPVISCVQWSFFEQWEDRYRLPFSRWMRALSAQRKYWYFIAQTRQMQRAILEHIPGAVVEHIPAGLDESEFQDPRTAPAPSASTPSAYPPSYALFLGRLDRDHKGLDLLLEAWEALPTEIPLVIAGEGPAKKWLAQRLAESQKLQRTITVVGRVEGREKKQLLAQAAFLVMPSRYETYGMVALEALAVGTPVICYQIANLDEVVSEHCAVLLPAFSTQALMEAVHALWRETARRNAMRQAAYQRACAYRWDALAQQQGRFYAAVVDHHHQAPSRL